MSNVEASSTPHRLGVHLVDGGATVSVYAAHATGIEICLFDADGVETRVPLMGPDNGLWHGFVPGIAEGQRYGFRASGPWKSAAGHRYNPAKLLLDPYGRGIEGELTPMTEPGSSVLLSTRDSADSAPHMPRSVVTSQTGHGWQTPKPNIAWEDTVMYELHVKGFTKLMEAIPEDLRGTYAGLAHPASVEHLKSLGITTLELLPVHTFINEQHLEHSGLSNYWGYSTLNFFTPHPGYATQAAQDAGAQAVLNEFIGMVDILHQHGLEVILDVVYNHTAEGSHSDRVLSWKGLDNLTYYRHQSHAPGHYDDTTGTGNTLDFAQPRVVQMAMDSLRYWLTEVGVDGFRFDLAATLGRTGQGFSTGHPFLTGITMDPVIGASKLVAEPWDVGLGGWQVGNFPQPMAEWNDRFRDKLRSFWVTDVAGKNYGRHHSSLPELGTRLAGSSDLFGHSEPPLMRGPIASVNFVTCHDGFTAHDVAAYNGKHNEANGEDNRDGTDNNNSWNHGAEGDTDDAGILAARRKTIRNLLGSTLLSAGTPMLLAGDEVGNTQGGNNNAYCQDNEISWVNWTLEPWQEDLRATVAHLVRLRHDNPVLRPKRFYDGHDDDPADSVGRVDLAFYTASGEHADDDWWEDPASRVMQMMRSLSVAGIADSLMVINGSLDDVDVTIPNDGGVGWRLAWDSAWESLTEGPGTSRQPGDVVTAKAMSMRVYLSEL